MDRRDFLKSTGAAAAALAASASQVHAGSETSSKSGDPLAAPAGFAKTRELILAMPWQPAIAGYADDALRLARRIETMSEDALRIELVSFAGQAPPQDALRLVPLQSRVADHPGFAYIGGLPGATALAANDLMGWLRDAGGQELWDGLALGQDVKALLAGHSGAEMAVWSRHPIDTVQAMAGVRIFARGLASDVARALGAEPVAISEAEAERDVLALDHRHADAAEWGSLAQADAIGLARTLPHAVMGLLTPHGAATALEIPLPVWRTFSGLERSVLAAATAAEYLASVDQERAARGLIERAIEARHGIALARPSAEVSAARDRVASAVVAHAAGFDATAARIDRSYMAYLRALGPKGSPDAQAVA